MEIVSWPAGVNRIILSDSNMNHNKDSVVSDKSENGVQMSRLNGSSSLDEWRVSMLFSNSRNNSFYKKHGITEWEMFTNWFKYKTCMGTKPFYFNKIGDSSDSKNCIYKIRGEGFPSYTFNGINVKVSMTWTETFNDFIQINLDSPHGDSINAYNGYVEMWFTDTPDEVPLKENFRFTYNHNQILNEPLVMEDFTFDGNKTGIFYFQDFENEGIYDIVCEFEYMNEEGIRKTKTLTDRFEV